MKTTLIEYKVSDIKGPDDKPLTTKEHITDVTRLNFSLYNAKHPGAPDVLRLDIYCVNGRNYSVNTLARITSLFTELCPDQQQDSSNKS